MRAPLGAGVLHVALSLAAVGQAPVRMTYAHEAMGTRFAIVLYADNAAVGDRAAAHAFARIDALDSVLSDYLPASETSRLAGTAGSGRAVVVSADLWAMLTLSREWAQRTAGAFDVTVGPLTRLWRWSARRGVAPPPDRWGLARAPVGIEHLRLDPEARTAELPVPGMRLDFGGIGKGFAADQALAVLAAHGIASALVDAGGDIALGSPPPGQPGWRVEIPSRDPHGEPAGTIVTLVDAAVATSGDEFRYAWVDGGRISHIVDPVRGVGIGERRIVTVVAARGADADALATALSVLGPDAGHDLLDRLPGVAAQILVRRDGRWVRTVSDGFPALAAAAP